MLGVLRPSPLTIASRGPRFRYYEGVILGRAFVRPEVSPVGGSEATVAAEDDGPEQGALGGSGEQGSFFSDAEVRPLAEDVGYRGQVACKAAGITYRQLDYWARTELVVPSIRPASGSGTQRLYSFRDILLMRIIKRLIDTGVSLQNVRVAVQHLADQGVTDLSQITLMSDGASVYECRSDDEVIDLVQGGQAVFGIAVGRVWQEVEGSLAQLPGEAVNGDLVTPAGVQDELANRRKRRTG